MQENKNQNLPYNEWLDVRDDNVFEHIKTKLNNDGEMVIVVSKTRSKFTMSFYKNGYFIEYGALRNKERKIRPKYIMRIDVSDKNICTDSYELIKT